MSEGTPEFEAKMGRIGRMIAHKDAMFAMLGEFKDVLDSGIPIVPHKARHEKLARLVDLIANSEPEEK
jgi:hypothetical protein